MTKVIGYTTVYQIYPYKPLCDYEAVRKIPSHKCDPFRRPEKKPMK